MKENTSIIKLYIAASLIVYCPRRLGSINWLTEYENNPETDYGYSSLRISRHSPYGRKTYEQVLGFGDWPGRREKVIRIYQAKRTDAPRK